VREVVASYRAVGITDFVFSWPPDDCLDTMRQAARELLPELRTSP
jgi:hypothetical protein